MDIDYTNMAQVFDKYPFFLFRFVLVIVIVVAFFCIYMRYRNNEYLKMITNKDSITGLMNCDVFKEHATQLIKKNTGYKYAMIQFDIDRFKIINDSYGIDGGNKVLKMIANDLKAMLDKNELATRFYADVFCVLLHYKNVDEITGFIENFNKQISSSIDSIKLDLLYGVYKIGEDISVDYMIDRAAFARNSVKGNSIIQYTFFDNKMLEKVKKEKHIEDTMQSALDSGEFEAYLQPQYSVKNEKIVSAEALVRWNDPDGKLIPPGEYIDLFEKNNFITKLDVFIWKQVFKIIRKWINQGREPYQISINVSPVHFKNRTILDEIQGVIDEYDVPHNFIELEITESILLDDLSYAVDTIEKLHNLGFKIAMDDFGSGYSSLNILNKLSIDVLKLDREFLNDSSNSKKGKIVISDIISMAKDLNMEVICEGVETREQVDFLKTTECDKIQGYFYAKPMSLIKFEKEYY